MLGAVELGPVRTDGDWSDRLVRVLSSYTTVLFEHPGLAQSAFVARPSRTQLPQPGRGRASAARRGRRAADRAAWALDLLLQFATATAAEHATRSRAIDASEEEDALAGALRSIDLDTHPHLAELGVDRLSGTGPDRLDWGFRVVINGALHTARP